MSALLSPLPTLLVCIILFLGGCAAAQQEILQTDGGQAPNIVYPAPTPVTPEPVESEPQAKSDFVERLRFAKPVTTTTVRARVQEITAMERTVPTYVWPEQQESLIVTKATIMIHEVLCGAPLSEVIDVSYVGGRLGRRSLRTSLMTQDLSVGQEYVFMLSKVADEHFIVGENTSSLYLDHKRVGTIKTSPGEK